MYVIMNDYYKFIDSHSTWTSDPNRAKKFKSENAAKVWINQNAPHLRQSTIIVPL